MPHRDATVRALPVRLNGRRLTVSQVAAVARSGPGTAPAAVTLTVRARQALQGSRQALLAHRGPIYGVTSGVGALDGATLPLEARARAPLALLRSHAVGLGPALPDDVVRAMMVTRLQQLATGYSGVSLELAEALVAMLARGVTPIVPGVGSVGASDLAPLAYVGLVLAGESRARLADGPAEPMPGAEVLRRAGLAPHRFDGRDALALLNGPALTVGRAALAVVDATRWLDAIEIAAGLSLTALAAPATTLDPRAIAGKRHRSAERAGARLRALTDLSEQQDGAVRREPLSGRALSQVLGSARDALDAARGVTEQELSAGVDNPMVAADGWTTNNASNGDTTRIGLALDHLSDALGAVAVQAERRIARLVDGDRGLPPFLLHPEAIPGVDSGLMIAQYAAAAAVAEIAGRSGATALRSLPVSGGSEDYNPMGPAAAQRCAEVVARFADVATIELLCAAQALSLRSERSGPRTRPALALVRGVVPVIVQDRALGDEIASLRAWVEQGGLDALDRTRPGAARAEAREQSMR